MGEICNAATLADKEVTEKNTNIWLLQRHEYDGGDYVRAYMNKINATNAMQNEMSEAGSRLATKKSIYGTHSVYNDDRGVLYSKEGKVFFEWNITSCELNEEPDPFIGPDEDEDKFYFNDCGFDWWYFNPNGNDEKGQYVENNLYPWTVMEGVRLGYDKDPDKFFMEWLSQEARQYLHDNDGSEHFISVDASFRNDPCDLMGCTEETMNAIIKWSKSKIDGH